MEGIRNHKTNGITAEFSPRDKIVLLPMFCHMAKEIQPRREKENLPHTSSMDGLRFFPWFIGMRT